MKFFQISLLLLVNAFLAFGNDENPENGVQKPPSSTGISSGHLPDYLPSLNLSPAELKVFAGHSLQLIKSKCPAVSTDKLTQLNKYISKLISKSNPVPKKSEQFLALVTSITTCSKKEVSLEEKDAAPAPTTEGSRPTFLDAILSKLHSLFGQDTTEDDEDDDDDVYIPHPALTVAFDEDKDYTWRPNLDSESTTELPEDVERVNPSKGDASTEDAPPAPETPSTESETSSTESTPTFIFETYLPSYTSSYSPWHPFSWFGNIFDMMRGFFSSLFGDGDDGDDLGSSSPVLRIRRSAGQLEVIEETFDETDASLASAAEDKTEDADAEQAPEPEPRYFIIHLNDKSKDIDAPTLSQTTTRMTGKDAFVQVIDNLCRIYCHDCAEKSQIINFKSAAKELLEFITKDTTGIELAAKHYLDPEFMQSLKEC